MKKRVIMLVIASMMSVAMVGCGADKSASGNGTTSSSSQQSKDSFSLGDVNTVKDVCEYKFAEVDAAQRIEPSSPSSYFTYYEAKTEGNVYVKVAFDVKNLASSSKSVDDIMKGKISFGSNEYTTFSVVEDAEGDNFSAYESIDSLETKRVVFLAEVPESATQEEMTLKLTINNKEYKNSFKIADNKPEKVYANVGQTLTKEGTSEMTITSLEYKDRLDPSAPDSYYSYYEVKDTSKVYLVLGVNVKNTKGTNLEADKVAGVTAIYNEKYNYKSFSVMEDADGSDLTGANICSIDPLGTNTIYYLIEMPKEVQTGSVEAVINYGGTKYYIKK